MRHTASKLSVKVRYIFVTPGIVGSYVSTEKKTLLKQLNPFKHDLTNPVTNECKT